MKLIRYSVLLTCFVLMLYSCKRYYAINMLGEDNIDVTYLIKKKRFKPIYNHNKKNEIIELINPNPLPITKKDLEQIKEYIERKLQISISDSLLREGLKYRSTYFITQYPVDCYDLNIKVALNNCYVEIRKENDGKNKEGRLILPASDEMNSKFICR